MNDYDRVDRMRDHWLEPDEPKPVTSCDYCGEELYEGDDYYYILGDVVCANCMDNMRRTVCREDFQ